MPVKPRKYNKPSAKDFMPSETQRILDTLNDFHLKVIEELQNNKKEVQINHDKLENVQLQSAGFITGTREAIQHVEKRVLERVERQDSTIADQSKKISDQGERFNALILEIKDLTNTLKNTLSEQKATIIDNGMERMIVAERNIQDLFKMVEAVCKKSDNSDIISAKDLENYKKEWSHSLSDLERTVKEQGEEAKNDKNNRKWLFKTTIGAAIVAIVTGFIGLIAAGSTLYLKSQINPQPQPQVIIREASK